MSEQQDQRTCAVDIGRLIYDAERRRSRRMFFMIVASALYITYVVEVVV